MESIYYSITWACHRKCRHCYEDRFRPYVREALAAVVAEAREAFPRIVANLPEQMTYLDLETPLPGGGWQERTGRIILSGGEVLVEAIREPVLYPLLERLRDKYRDRCKLIVQTTGDLLTERIIGDLLERGVWMIQVAGMDDFHVGFEGDRRVPLQERLTRWFEAAGMKQRTGLRQVGDLSLFISGFFGDSLRRKLVDVDYYASIGGTAYTALSRFETDALASVFAELAENFVAFVDVLSEVSERTSCASNADLLRLYERWLRTGSQRSGQLLIERGVVPNLSAKTSRVQ